MRPSSSPPEPGLFDGVLAAGGVRAGVSDRAWPRALLDAEAELAGTNAEAGLIEAVDAEAVVTACAGVVAGLLDPGGYLGSADSLIDRALRAAPR